MKLDSYYYRVVFTASTCSKEKIRELTQQEKRLIDLSCKALRTNYTNGSNNEKKELKKLIAKLITPYHVERPVNECSNRICKALISIFKWIANSLHLRISTKYLKNHVNNTLNFQKNELFEIYQDMLGSLKRLKYKDLNSAFKGVEALYFLSLHTNRIIELQKNPHLQRLYSTTPKSYMKEKTCLSIDNINRAVIDSIRNAPGLFAKKYQEAKKANRLEEFFEKIFPPNAKNHFPSLYQSIKNFAFPVPPPKFVDRPKVNVEPLVINAEKKDKAQTLWSYGETFIEGQIKKYALAKGYDVNENWNKTKENIENNFRINPLNQQNFYVNYANLKNFSQFIERANLINLVCADGPITAVELPNLVKGTATLMGLGETEEVREQPRINLPLPVQQIPLFPQPQPQWPLVFMQNLVPNNPIAIVEPPVIPYQSSNIIENEFKEPYQAILQDLENLHLGSYLENLIKETIVGFYKISLHGKDLWKYAEQLRANEEVPYKANLERLPYKESTNPKWWFLVRMKGMALTGITIHFEEVPEDKKFEKKYVWDKYILNRQAEYALRTCTEFLLTTYKKAKEEGNLYNFFTQGLNNFECLDGRYSRLAEWSREQDELTDIKIPKIEFNPRKTKLENIYEIRQDFLNLQAMKYATDNQIKIDKHWLEDHGTRHQIINTEKHAAKFETYFNDVKFKEVLEGLEYTNDQNEKVKAFTQDEIDAFTKQLVGECVLNEAPK